jgi:integral membrane sensor domain MASE1
MVSAYVCMYACMYVCMYACMYACVHVCMYECMLYVCMHVCMYACASKQASVRCERARPSIKGFEAKLAFYDATANFCGRKQHHFQFMQLLFL